MKTEKIPGANDDAWSIAEGKRDDLPSILRFRPGLEPFIGDARYSRRLQITWAFADASESGMPSEDDSDDMQRMEDALVNTLEATDAGILAFVYTYGGTRSWTFYVGDSEELGELINDALSELPGLPIELVVEDDAEWAELALVLRTVRASAAGAS